MAVTTDTTDLGSSRVRVEAVVDPSAVESELRAAAAEIGKEMKLPGFRKGHVPAEVVIQQLGRESVIDEAIRRGLPAWYDDAIGAAGIATVGDPALDIGDAPAKGEPLKFSFEIGIRPEAELGEWKGLEVGKPAPEVTDAEIDAELERLRESLASLEAVDRAAGEGDWVVIDFEGTIGGQPFEGGEARGFVLELGSGRLIEGFESQLVGASAGEDRTVRATFPDDYHAEHLAGNEAEFAVSVKEVKSKQLPELDDELAVEAGGFDTLDELRADLAERMGEGRSEQIEQEFREAAVDAVAAAARIDVPHDLIHSKAHEMWHITARRLAQQGLDPQRYLEMIGKTEHELAEESEDDAERALRREAALAAVIADEGIEVSDEELLDALRDVSARTQGKEPSEKALRRSLAKARKRGQDAALREDIAMRKAVDLIVASVEPIEAGLAEAREKLWTPDQ